MLHTSSNDSPLRYGCYIQTVLILCCDKDATYRQFRLSVVIRMLHTSIFDSPLWYRHYIQAVLTPHCNTHATCKQSWLSIAIRMLHTSSLVLNDFFCSLPSKLVCFISGGYSRRDFYCAFSAATISISRFIPIFLSTSVALNILSLYQLLYFAILKILCPYLGASDFGRPPIFRWFALDTTLLVMLSW